MHNEYMHADDLELGPIQRTFDTLNRSISLYFNSHLVSPNGPIKESDLSDYSQKKLRETLVENLDFYGFSALPASLRPIVESSSKISGIQRSDDIVVYDEKMSDGSRRIYNFYTSGGPENMQVSYYWLDQKKGGEQTRGILSSDNRLYLRISTADGIDYYLRIERENPQ
jgi:hypothetical protein